MIKTVSPTAWCALNYGITIANSRYFCELMLLGPYHILIKQCRSSIRLDWHPDIYVVREPPITTLINRMEVPAI